MFRPALWQLLASLGVPQKFIGLISALYFDTSSSVRVEGQLSPSFPISSGVRQGCVLAPSLFNTGMDWVLDRAVARGMNGVAIGSYSFSDFDYADDVALLSELVSLLQSTLEIFSAEAAPLGLQVNWAKKKVQSLSDSLTIEGQSVECVDSLSVYVP